MNKKKKTVLVIIVGATVGLIGISAYALWSVIAANDLGLTAMDLAVGAPADMRVLRTQTKTVADAHLAQHRIDLMEACGRSYKLNLDYSLSSKIRSLGYQSSFYYYCWDIYLPYSVTTEQGRKYIVVVQLSDSITGHKHDPNQFRVLRMMAIDDKGQTVQSLG
jgi:hypothetical protein